MQRETILRTPRGLEIPLIPAPYCRYCTNPITERWGKISGRCWSCSQRLKSVAEGTDPSEPFWDPAAPRATPIQPYAFKRAAAVGLYVRDGPSKGEFGRLVTALKYQGEGAADLAEALDMVLHKASVKPPSRPSSASG